MKNSKCLIFGCVFALLALPLFGAVQGASAQNILTNGDFETGDTTGWVVFGAGANSTVVVQAGDNGVTLPGNYSVFMDNQAPALGLGLKQTTVPGSVGEGEVTYSFDLKLDQADVGGVIFVQIFAEGEGIGIVGGSGLLGPLWPWGAWTNYSGSFMAPANTSFITFQITATTGAAEGSNCVMHLDNVSVEQQGAVPDEASSWSNVKALFR